MQRINRAHITLDTWWGARPRSEYNAGPMFPIEIPIGTTPATFFEAILPKAHAELVKGEVSDEIWVVGVKVKGHTTYTLTIRGKSLSVEDKRPGPVPLWIQVEDEALAFFLNDFATTKRFVPKFVPASGFTTMTDPRLLKRVAMVSGKVEISLMDSPIGKISLFCASGTRAKEGIFDDDPDATIEVHMPTAEKVLSGLLGPEEALSGGHVALRGKRLVAMQFALAIAPFYQPLSR